MSISILNGNLKYNGVYNRAFYGSSDEDAAIIYRSELMHDKPVIIRVCSSEEVYHRCLDAPNVVRSGYV